MSAVVPLPSDLLDHVEVARRSVTRSSERARRARMGQFMTPEPVARMMASMLSLERDTVSILDPGAGVGSLTAALVAELLGRDRPPNRIEVVAYELDSLLEADLVRTLELCSAACSSVGVSFEGRCEISDFLEAASANCDSGGEYHFDCAILNPPYRKVGSQSPERRLCREMGLEVPNLYAGFVGAAALLLKDGGEMVAITPRSFANGPYFRSFRSFLLDRMAFRRLHVFESRNEAFREDDVLQENLIVHADKAAGSPEFVAITASRTPDDEVTWREVHWSRVVYEHDAEQFIHLIDGEEADAVAERIGRLDNYLSDLRLSVSTGPVVDFRAVEFLRSCPGTDTVPLLYPTHLQGGVIQWPREQAKWNAFVLNDKSERQTVPKGNYVLVRRFTAKEERRRVVSAVYEAGAIETERVGFENHLNYFHAAGSGIPLDLARGLALYLNSSLVDSYFRQFSGHTQVNAADLRNIPYPGRARLEAAGRAVGASVLDQDGIDRAVERHLSI